MPLGNGFFLTVLKICRRGSPITLPNLRRALMVKQGKQNITAKSSLRKYCFSNLFASVVGHSSFLSAASCTETAPRVTRLQSTLSMPAQYGAAGWHLPAISSIILKTPSGSNLLDYAVSLRSDPASSCLACKQPSLKAQRR